MIVPLPWHNVYKSKCRFKILSTSLAYNIQVFILRANIIIAREDDKSIQGGEGDKYTYLKSYIVRGGKIGNT